MSDEKQLKETWEKKMNDNFDVLARLFIKGARTVSGNTTIDPDVDSVVITSGANGVISVPIAVPANKNKAFLCQFTNGTITNSQVQDLTGTPLIIAVATARYDSFLCISLGDVTLGNNGYFVVGFGGVAAATS